MSKYHDDNTQASDPGEFSLDRKEFRRLEGYTGIVGLFWKWKGREFEEILTEHLSFGDSRAAVVVSENPLLVAAYSDEIDGVAMLKFSKQVRNRHRLPVDAWYRRMQRFILTSCRREYA